MITCFKSSMEAFCYGPQTKSTSFLVRITRGLACWEKSLTQIHTTPHTPRNLQTSVRVLQSGQSKIFWTSDPPGNVLHKCNGGQQLQLLGCRHSFSILRRFLQLSLHAEGHCLCHLDAPK